jgi:outer membrane protein
MTARSLQITLHQLNLQEVSIMRFFCSAMSLALLIAMAAGSALADETVSLKAGYLMLSPEGTFAVSDTTLIGTPIDLEKDLGFDDSQDYFVEGALQLGSFRLSGSYTPLEFKGLGTLSQNFNFNGQTFSGSAQTASDVNIDLLDVGLAWYLINFDDLPVRLQLGPELSVKYVQADLSVVGESTSAPGVVVTETESADVPIPTLGARARVGIADFMAVIGRVGYLEYNDNSFLDADAQIEFSPIPLVGVFGGYRYLDIQVDDSGVLIDATFSGPYAGALVRF